MGYNYLENEIEDVKSVILDLYEKKEILEKIETKAKRFAFAEKLNDDLWTEDGVTGNASGSYTFSTYKAEEFLRHNFDLLCEACDGFGQDLADAIKRGAEFCDVTIRCYLLPQAIEEALCQIEREN